MTRTPDPELRSACSIAFSCGYGIEDQKNELGIICIAVPVFGASSATPTGTISISALRFRYPLKRPVRTARTLAARVHSALAG